MKVEFRLITGAVITAILISAAVVEGARSRPLNEDAALALLERTLKRDRVYEKRISLDCIAYGTEETTNAYFEFVLREIHNAKCGGDPETSPAIDRYRVYRRSGKSSSGKQLKTNGSRISARQTRRRKDFVRTHVAPAEAGAIMTFCR